MIRLLCFILVSMVRIGFIGLGRWVSFIYDLYLNIGNGMLFYNCLEKWVNFILKYIIFR